jgi:hypothetical protein
LKSPDDILNLPNWLYYFLHKKKFAVYLYTLIYGDRYPVYWIKLPAEEKAFDMALNPIKYIFPKSHNRFSELVAMSDTRQWQNFIEEVIASVEIKDDKTFNSLIDIIRKSFEEFSAILNPRTFIPDKTIIDSFLEFSIDDDLAEIIVGEKLDDELLDDFIIDNAIDFSDDDVYVAREELPDEKSGSDLSDPDRDLINDLHEDVDEDF